MQKSKNSLTQILRFIYNYPFSHQSRLDSRLFTLLFCSLHLKGSSGKKQFWQIRVIWWETILYEKQRFRLSIVSGRQITGFWNIKPSFWNLLEPFFHLVYITWFITRCGSVKKEWKGSALTVSKVLACLYVKWLDLSF